MQEVLNGHLHSRSCGFEESVYALPCVQATDIQSTLYPEKHKRASERTGWLAKQFQRKVSSEEEDVGS